VTARHGCSRTVFLVRSWAIKMPTCRYGLSKFLLGWYSNRMECDRWSWAMPHECLCPVVGSFLWGFFIVMERADPVEEGELLPMEIEDLRALSEDVHAGNVGRLDGRLVLVDYA